MEVLAVIMARAGSKGLPGKAMRNLLGRPVISYTFDHARQAKRVTRVVVSSDDRGVLELARRESLEVIERPADLASDTAATDAVLRHAVRVLAEREGYDPDVVVMLYGNVPIRRGGEEGGGEEMIDKCVAMLADSGCDSVQTISPVGKYHPYWMFTQDEAGRIQKYAPNEVYRRQDLPPLFSPTGAVYAMKTSVLLAAEGQRNPHAFLGANRRGLLTESGDSVDIDTAQDFYLAEAMLRAQNV